MSLRKLPDTLRSAVETLADHPWMRPVQRALTALLSAFNRGRRRPGAGRDVDTRGAASPRQESLPPSPFREEPSAEGPGADMAKSAGNAASAAPVSVPSVPSAPELGPQVTARGVCFRYRPEGAPRRVALAGSFNRWNPDDPAYRLRDEDGDGVFTLTVRLDPGVHLYKFVVGSDWHTDPHAPMYAPDGVGGQNSKIEIP